MEGNASVYQVNTVSRITGEGRAEFLRTWGPGFDQNGAGGGRVGQLNMCVETIRYFEGINVTVLEVYHVHPGVSRTISE